MGALLKSTIERTDVSGVASIVLVLVAALFLAIAIWAVRAESGRVFERASRLPLDEEARKAGEIQ